jgi:hypothetical protein
MFSFFNSKPAARVAQDNPFNETAWKKDVYPFLESARKVAHDILGPEEEKSYHCHCVGRVKERYFWTWWPMSPFYYYDPYPRYPVRTVYVDSRNDSDETTRWLVGIAAAILGGYAIFKVVDAIQRRQEASEELTDNWEFSNKLRIYEHTNPHIPHLGEIKQIAQLKYRIFSQLKSNATWDLILRISFVAASAIALVGAVAASSACMIAGVSLGLATASVMLCQWATDRTVRYLQRDARLLRHHLSAL